MLTLFGFMSINVIVRRVPVEDVIEEDKDSPHPRSVLIRCSIFIRCKSNTKSMDHLYSLQSFSYGLVMVLQWASSHFQSEPEALYII